PKCRRRIPGVTAESRREMAWAAEPDLLSDPFDGECRLTKEQVTRGRQTFFQHVSVWGHPQALAKRALKVTYAYTRQQGEFVQGDWLRKVFFYVVHDDFDAVRRQSAIWSGRRLRQ